MIIDSHTNEDNKGETRANLPLEHIFGFCKNFRKITIGLGFELKPKTANEKQNIFTQPLVVMFLMWLLTVYIFIYQVLSHLLSNKNFLMYQLGKVLHYLLILGCKIEN